MQTSHLRTEVAKIKTQIVDRLGKLTSGQRRREIAKMCRQAEKDAERVTQRLGDAGETNEDVWQAEVAKVEAPYYAALEAFRDECPRGEE